MKYHGITIHKNKKCKTWYTRFRKDGIQNYISAKTQQECLEKLKQCLELPPRQKRNTITFIQWYNKWFNLFKNGKVEQSTVNDYEFCLRQIPDNIKNKDITKISSLEIINILDTIKAERSKQKVYELLKAIFTKATAYKIIKSNIIDIIEKPKHEKEKGIALSYEQQQLFINACNNNKYGDIFKIILYQGLRVGEMLAITGHDIDLKNKKLIINKAINKDNKISHTKNKQSNRIMPLFNKTIEIIKKYTNNENRIFNISYTTTQRNLKDILQKCNLPQNISIHDLRHTFITNCKNKNIPEHVIQALVGHEIGSSVTKQVYTHYNETDNLSYIDKLND